MTTAVSDDGNALKVIGQGEGGGVGTNASGFSALLGGSYQRGVISAGFAGLGDVAYFWSSTLNDSSSAFSLSLLYNTSMIYVSAAHRSLFGFSVRCVRD